jgi:hypothetical protein
MPDFDASSDAQTELAETYGSHYPALAKAKRVTLKEAGTVTVRPPATGATPRSSARKPRPGRAAAARGR